MLCCAVLCCAVLHARRIWIPVCAVLPFHAIHNWMFMITKMQLKRHGVSLMEVNVAASVCVCVCVCVCVFVCVFGVNVRAES